MGTKRVGLARTQALIENLKRELTMGGASQSGMLRTVIAKDDDYTVVMPDDCGKIITTRGAGSDLTFTLPAASGNSGAWCTIAHVTDVKLHVTGTDEEIVALNDATADKVSAQTSGQRIGAQFDCYCDGTSWFVIGVTVGVTYTVTSA